MQSFWITQSCSLWHGIHSLPGRLQAKKDWAFKRIWIILPKYCVYVCGAGRDLLSTTSLIHANLNALPQSHIFSPNSQVLNDNFKLDHSLTIGVYLPFQFINFFYFSMLRFICLYEILEKNIPLALKNSLSLEYLVTLFYRWWCNFSSKRV